ncbi:MAG: hypothetical protein ABIB61_01115 [Candidatus Shapirobacteria bacterium]
MNNNHELIFYIIREKSDDGAKDFSDFIYNLKGSFAGIETIQDSPTKVTLSGHANYQSQLEYLSANNIPDNFKDFSFCLKLTIGCEDYATFSRLRFYLFEQKDFYRIFSLQLKSFLPRDNNFVSLEFGSINIKTFEILRKYSLLPVFYLQINNVYYAADPQGTIHIINPYLLEYIYNKEIPELKLSELSYPVANSINLFSAKADKELIPADFYEYYNKSVKIINKSFFDINHQNRKVFLKPFIFEFKPAIGEFYNYTGEGGALLFMDKIRPGETLDISLKRILSQDLKIADDYIAALVSKEIEFDRDREGILTPRLSILVYVDHIKNKAHNLQLSQTGWKSVDGAIPSIKPNPNFQKSN